MIEFKREVVRDVVVLTLEKTDQPGAAGIIELKNLLRRLTISGSKRFVVDMGALDMLESSGIGVIMGCMRFLLEKEAVIVFSAMAPNVLMALKVTNLTKVIPYRKTVQEGLDAIEKMPLKREFIDRLLVGNPPIQLASEQPPPVARRSSEAVDTRAAAPAPPPPASAISTPSVAPPAEKPVDDWSRALELFGNAQDFFARNGVAFSSDTSFREAFAALAEKLRPRR
ncbi:hypothetical protein BH09SUM1_BH09SUM1_18210 [soil metagenome]